jgi:phage/plasmid-like protein (TIGR03299 family)
MSHDLEINKSGNANFVYRIGGGAPWHGLGHGVEAHMNAPDILEACHADYEVLLVPVFAQNPVTKEFVEVPDRFVTGRQDPHSAQFQPWETVKGRYAVVQNDVVLSKALDVVGASNGDAVMETAGVLNDGREFFASIDVGQTIIDPNGVHDVIEQYILVHTSHDGTAPITYANTSVRPVCANTVRFGKSVAKSTYTARHTTNVEGRLDEAAEVLGIARDWDAAFKLEAERFIAAKVEPGSNRIDSVLDAVWPSKDADTDRKQRNRERVVASVRNRLGNERNAGGFGWNAWSLLQAITEHIDHGRDVDSRRAAEQAMSVYGTAFATKLRAHGAISELVVNR